MPKTTGSLTHSHPCPHPIPWFRPFGHAFSRLVCPQTSGTKFRNRAGPQTLMNDLFQLFYSVFSNSDMAKKVECTPRTMQTPYAVGVSALQTTNGVCLWGQFGLWQAHGYPDRTTAACVENRAPGGGIAVDTPSAKRQGIGRGNAPDAREHRPPQSLIRFCYQED